MIIPICIAIVPGSIPSQSVRNPSWSRARNGFFQDGARASTRAAEADAGCDGATDVELAASVAVSGGVVADSTLTGYASPSWMIPVA
ncbi:MAG TPA: hypothetical protein DEU95_07425 [Chloroflexi bacterium]|nr:hypothetical protein [Chloroflexota bacterium]